MYVGMWSIVRGCGGGGCEQGEDCDCVCGCENVCALQWEQMP